MTELEGSNINVLDHKFANWNRDDGFSVMQDFLARFPEFAKLYLMSRRIPSRMNVHLRTHLMKLRTLSFRRHLHLLMENLFPMEAPIPSST